LGPSGWRYGGELEDLARLGASASVRHPKYNSGDRIKKNEMGGSSGTCGTEEQYKAILWGNPKKTDHLGDLHVNGRTILKSITKVGSRGLDLSGSG
jgi:hypothetical protein